VKALASGWTGTREVARPSAAHSDAWHWVQRGVAASALGILSPLFALLWVLVRATSRGPFLFTQSRRGLGGRPFTIYKIRTMSVGSEAHTALGVQRGNAYVTRVGRILRELKLDELPQLYNVARGDMAFVGPRPIPMALEDEIVRNVPRFAERQQARPGLTNLAQVSLDDNGEDPVADWAQRSEAELLTVRRSGVAHDLVVIALTLCFLLRRATRRVWPAQRQATPAGAATAILGVPIHNQGLGQTVARVGAWVRKGQRRMVCVVPVHSLMDSFRHPGHRRALLESDHNTADGVPIMWAQRLFGHREAERVYGPDLTLELLCRGAAEGWRVAFYGGRPERLELLVERMSERFPALDVVFAQSPPFRPLSVAEDAQVVTALAAARPDLVLVGLGAPKQEAWMADHRGRIPGVLVGVGAAFDFHAGAVPQAPPVLQRWGLEWAFRLAIEPRRLLRRYATSNPAYVARLAHQWVQAKRGATFQLGVQEAA
jgi:N-acetylglucosaminyldiphosphoundecaprenol N-acetyl-beta-D-mannosaminyltransferase